MDIELRELTPQLWPQFERLFGSNGACGGCWCMWWRIEKGERWPEVKGALAKRHMRRLVQSGQARGLLAFIGAEPVGWLAYGKRTEFSRLDRAPSLACHDADRVWSLPCFFVKVGYRGRGIAAALLGGALRSLRRQGARTVEAYPVKPAKQGERIPAAFAYTGTVAMFEAAGFSAAQEKQRGKRRMRIGL
jgi:GNAT superfamily N-acetyltransferase